MSFWWKCEKCQGTGRVFNPWYAKKSERCFACDGTGNACVDGAAAAHRRRLLEEQIAEFGNRFAMIEQQS